MFNNIESYLLLSLISSISQTSIKCMRYWGDWKKMTCKLNKTKQFFFIYRINKQQPFQTDCITSDGWSFWPDRFLRPCDHFATYSKQIDRRYFGNDRNISARLWDIVTRQTGSLRWWFTDVAGRWLGCSPRWRLGRLGSLCPLRGPHRVDNCIPDATRVTDECVPNQVVHAGRLRVIRRSEIPQHGRSAWIHSDGIVRQGGWRLRRRCRLSLSLQFHLRQL